MAKATFGKAQPKQARLKVAIYGPPGSGKTFTTLLMAEGLAKVRERRIKFVDTERGTDFYAQASKSRAVHPEAFDFDALYTRSLADVLDALHSLDPKDCGVVVIDSITHLWEAAMDAYIGKRTKIDSIPMHAWGKIKKPYKDLMKFLVGCPYDVFILGRQKNLFENGDDGEMQKVGVAMRAEGETAYEPHICMRMESRMDPKDSRQMQSVNVAYVEKDRTGVLAGKALASPSFKTIEPLLPLLGEEQAEAEDEDARIENDSQLHDKQDEKAAAKAQGSSELFGPFQVRLAACVALPELSAIADEIKKAKRKLTLEHIAALGELYKHARDRIVAAVASDFA